MSGDAGGVATEPPDVPATGIAPPTARRPGVPVLLLRAAGRHWLLLALLAAGTALRVVALLAYPPALLYIDSYRYLYNLGPLSPDELDPIGYDLILKPLLAWGGLELVVLLQHLLGLVVAVAVYALARRYGVRNWLAALATAPVLLDAYQVQIEQNIMSDLWLEVLLVGVCWVLLRRGTPGPVAAGVAGLLLGAAVTVRTIALPLLLPLLVFLVVAGGAWRSRAGWRRVGVRAGALLLCCGLVLFCYAGYFHRETGMWGLTGSSDSVLYGRTADLADCGQLNLAPELRRLCPAEPLGQRKGVDWYAHLDGDPNWPPGGVPAGETVQSLQHRFAIAVIERQPVDVAEAVLADFGKGFGLGRNSSPDDVPVGRWQFQTYYPIWTSLPEAVYYTERYSGTRPGVRPPLAAFLRDYQLGGGYTPGPALAAFALLGVAGSVWRRRSGVRSAAALITGSGLVLLFGSAMFEFSWRYQLPGLVLLPLGGVIGLAGLLGPLRRPAPPRPRLRAWPQDADWLVLRRFTARYGPRKFAPVLLLCRDAVPAGVPAECAGLPVDCLVLTGSEPGQLSTVDGSPVCVVPPGRGPGGALRLGFRLAGYGGAEYVALVHSAADPAELPRLLAPLLAGEADLVLGRRSRWAAPGLVVLRAGLAGRLDLREADFPAAELPGAARAAGGTVLVLPLPGASGPGRDERPGRTGAVLRTWLRGRRGQRSPGAPGSP